MAEPSEGGRKPKRDKPTLNCSKCVEKKTKCDRGRPHCVACVRRGTECSYMERANMIEYLAQQARIHHIRNPLRPTCKGPQIPPPPQAAQNDDPSLPNIDTNNGKDSDISLLNSSVQRLLSIVPQSISRANNVYGIGSGHPFPNYWTLGGGFAEVVQVLPRKEQAEVLLENYFERIDPIYCIIHRPQFYRDYNAFLLLDPSELSEVDGPFICLLLIMLAMSTQFLNLPKSGGKASVQKETAEFYACACHQSLHLCAYFNHTSIRILQAMTLMTYYLLNDNHASDGWAFAGILVRQAYTLGLNLDPSRFGEDFSNFEKQERRILWRAIVCQDAFMSMILKLPPGATHTNVDVTVSVTEIDSSSSILTPNGAEILEEGWYDPKSNIIEEGFTSGMYKLALLVQEKISSPRSLSLPISTTCRHRSQLLSRFRNIYSSMPDVYRGWDENKISEIAKENKRLVRQILFFASNYWHCVTLVQVEGVENCNTRGGVGGITASARAAIEAALEAARTFFVLHTVLQSEASVWWVCCHRGFTAALILAEILQKHGQRLPKRGETVCQIFLDPLFKRSIASVWYMIEILESTAEQDETTQMRIEALKRYIQ